MKTYLLLPALLIITLFNQVFPQQNVVREDKPADVYFREVRAASIDKLPDSFTAGLSGQSIDKKLSSIPADSYLDKSRPVTAAVSYSKEKGISITVRNVDDLYRDIYKDLPRQFFAFDILLSVKTTEVFLKKYEVSYNSNGNNERTAVLKLSIRGALNNVLLYIDRQNLQIGRIDYLIGEDLLSTTQVFYTDFSNSGETYSIPVRFVSKILAGSNSGKSENFEIVGISLGQIK